MELIERIRGVWDSFMSSPELMVAMSVSVLVFSVLYYYMMKFLVDNNSGPMVVLFVFTISKDRFRLVRGKGDSDSPRLCLRTSRTFLPLWKKRASILAADPLSL